MGGRTSTSGQGRKKGVPNKITGDIKAMILGALERAGGTDYLYRQTSENPTAFLALVGKIVPKDVKIEGEIDLRATIREAFLKMGEK